MTFMKSCKPLKTHINVCLTNFVTNIELNIAVQGSITLNRGKSFYKNTLTRPQDYDHDNNSTIFILFIFQCIIGNEGILSRFRKISLMKKVHKLSITSRCHLKISITRQARESYTTSIRRKTLIRVETSLRKPVNPPLSLSFPLPSVSVTGQTKAKKQTQ